MVLAACWTRTVVAASGSSGTVRATAANPSNPGPIELAIRSATSLLTDTPAMSAVALISFAVGLVMPHPLPSPARGCGPSPVSPYSTPPRDPFYRWQSVLASHLRRAAPRTDIGCETGTPRAVRSDWADRPRSAATQ